MTANPLPLDAAARDFTPISAAEAQSFLAHARKDFTSEANELGYVPVQPCDLERLSLTILALLAAVERGAELAEGVRHAERERAILGVHHTRLPEMAERFDAAARAHPPTQETDDAESR